MEETNVHVYQTPNEVIKNDYKYTAMKYPIKNTCYRMEENHVFLNCD